MANKMLIDAAHPEETRVVVLRGNRVEEFDFESASRKQLRGKLGSRRARKLSQDLSRDSNSGVTRASYNFGGSYGWF